MGLLAWSPLGRGVLTGKYRDGVPGRLAGRGTRLGGSSSAST